MSITKRSSKPHQGRINRPDAAASCAPVFIVGCPRSGTTLLRNLLRSHPNLFFPSESHFIPKIYRRFGDPEDERHARNIAEAVLRIKYVRDWGLGLDPSAFSQACSYAEIIDGIYGNMAAAEGKKRWCDKTPQYLLDVPLLVALFPKCKVLHIYRDGRDVALSMERVNFGPNNTFIAAVTWKKYMEAASAYRGSLDGKNYFEVRYESLLHDSENVLRDVCAFIEEPFSSEILAPTLIKTRWRRPLFGEISPSQSLKKTIIRDNAAKWKNQMPSKKRILFEAVAGDLLADLGYEIERHDRKIRSTERLFWNLHQFVHWGIDRLNSRDKMQWLRTDLYLRLIDIRYNLGRGKKS